MEEKARLSYLNITCQHLRLGSVWQGGKTEGANILEARAGEDAVVWC